MKTSIFAAVAAVTMCAQAAFAAPIDAPVPDENFITIDGDDWAWAAPCDAVSPSCGVVDLSYQSGQGWALATVQQMNDVLAAAGGSAAFAALFGPSNNFKCAAAWFSERHSHCDYSNGANGQIWNLDPQGGNYFWETFAVRTAAVSAVPVPASLPLLTAGILGLGWMRRRAAKKA